MARRTALSTLGAIALIGASLGSAHAYFAEGDNFAARAGSAATLTLRDSLLEPTALAIRNALAEKPKIRDANLKRDLAALSEFYAARQYKTEWMVDGRLGDPAKQLLTTFTKADEDGLNPADYPVPAADFGANGAQSPDNIAAAELSLGQSVLLYGRQAYAGRVDPRSISENITIDPVLPDPAEILASVIASADPAATLHGYNPEQEGYLRLREQLAEARATAAASHQKVVPSGPSLKLGMTDPRVVILRERLGITDPAEDPTLYDETVVAAVKDFQKSNGLNPDGIVGPNTLSNINGNAADEVADIIANMERWRWLPHQLGRFYIKVNVPSFVVDVYKDGAHIFDTRVVVGKVTNQTPIFNDEMEHVIVNPYWNVPESITLNEMLPAILSDPAFFAHQNYEVLASDGKRWQVIDPYRVNWNQLDTRHVRLRQPPGAGNALGVIKFMFPNEHDVYLHDTPAKSLFARDVRAFSHGCVRLMEPMKFADVVFSEEPEWSAARVKKLVGGAEQQVNLTHHIPIYITYFTAWVDDDGLLQTRRDIYGHNARVKAALGL